MLGLKVQDNAEFGAEIIRKVREKGGLSRVELARELGVAASTIGRHVDALVSGQYFTETVEPTREAGRPPTRLRPNAGRGCFVGVDFYSSSLYATAVDFAQHNIVQKSYELNGKAGVDFVLEELAGALKDMSSAAGMPVLAVGLATPGRVDASRGVALHYAQVPGFLDVPLAEKMQEVTGAKTFVENNIRTMALAERWFGVARGCQELICLGVRVGITAGIVHQGQLSTGYRGLGGEVRGMNCPVYDAQKDEWSWGADNAIETTASVPAVLSRYFQLSGEEVEMEAFLAAVEGRVPAAMIALKEAAAVHGWLITQMAQVTDPEMVVLSGPLTKMGDVYLDVVKEMSALFASNYYPQVPIHLSELGEFAGAVGAAGLALERWRPDDMG
ncbi:ROK family protein [Phragmitibacter flavus]|uniref:ROK family protein n=1 Tax=Phragmitibacter flavus TaxID=2576071 RepID=A0A5R8KBA3_9BACT|nr:ROK family protein [Phragmitibacter flavus]TLD69205.1 ROK family protein [Phragmitibacter flavus]